MTVNIAFEEHLKPHMQKGKGSENEKTTGLNDEGKEAGKSSMMQYSG